MVIALIFGRVIVMKLLIPCVTYLNVFLPSIYGRMKRKHLPHLPKQSEAQPAVEIFA